MADELKKSDTFSFAEESTINCSCGGWVKVGIATLADGRSANVVIHGTPWCKKFATMDADAFVESERKGAMPC